MSSDTLHKRETAVSGFSPGRVLPPRPFLPLAPSVLEEVTLWGLMPEGPPWRHWLGRCRRTSAPAPSWSSFNLVLSWDPNPTFLPHPSFLPNCSSARSHIKKAKHQRIDAYELWYWKTLESLLDGREIKPVNLKGNQPWIFTGRTDAEAEAPALWSPGEKNLFIGKDPVAGKDWGQEKKRATEDELVEWHHRLDEHELEHAPGVGDGQGGLALFVGSSRIRHNLGTEW